MPNAAAQAQFFRALARALDDLARATFDDAPDAVVAEDSVDSPDPVSEFNLGSRQRQIVDLPGLTEEAGLKTAEIAGAIGYEVPNTYTALQSLARHGVIEQIAGVEPQRWRLARRYRPNTAAFMRIARLVREGEWTTYGDVSITVLGNHKASRGVGRAAATVKDFPNPHRILMEGGKINEHWLDDQGRGPEECRRRLEEEGIRFIGDHADETQRVAWDELMRREAQEALGG